MFDRGQEFLTIRIERIEPSEYKDFERLVRRHTGSDGSAYLPFFGLIALAALVICALNRDPVTAGIFVVAVILYASYFK